MAVGELNSTMPGAVTPVCGRCGIYLCWDISEEEYAADREFWDAWICERCNGDRPMSLKEWRRMKNDGVR